MEHKPNYILFIDESGKSKLSDDHNDFLLTGLIIDAELHAALSNYMISLKEKSAIPTDENIHAFDLFEGEREKMYGVNGKPLKNADGTRRHKRIPFARINTFFGRLTALIEGADATCNVLRINKGEYRDRITRTAARHGVPEKNVLDFLKRKGLNDFLYEALARKLILEFGYFLEQNDAQGAIMAESRRQEDEAVLDAFLSATQPSTFPDSQRFHNWSRSCLRRIHSITFQNKKGLSFGLEVADLFSWAHYNRTCQSTFPIDSAAKRRRVSSRIEKVDRIMQPLLKRPPSVVSRQVLGTVASDRVSEFTEALAEYRPPAAPSGTPPGNPGGPYRKDY